MYLNIQELRDFYSVTKVGRKFNKDLLNVVRDFISKSSFKDVALFGYINDFSADKKSNVTSCMFTQDNDLEKKGAYSIGDGIIDKSFSQMYDKFYDCAIIVNSLEFAEDIDSFFEGVFSKVKDDGKILLISMSYKSIFNKHPFDKCHTFSKHAIEHAVIEHGVRIDDFYYTCYPHFKSKMLDKLLGCFLKFYGAFMVLECTKETVSKVVEEVQDLKLGYEEG